ncbi:hypothetical protein AAFF_G00295470 [Aldrovandia affinis]|uniref:Uncharacterized protein n=1 Tax=Aldrovandia affinis TaxID=143900 RepID=A0AAD7W1E2_9TELE|nr:hypothetical protein AAFF_G00295470 [Aldrovandia affinis]
MIDLGDTSMIGHMLGCTSNIWFSQLPSLVAYGTKLCLVTEVETERSCDCRLVRERPNVCTSTAPMGESSRGTGTASSLSPSITCPRNRFLLPGSACLLSGSTPFTSNLTGPPLLWPGP